MTDKTRDERLKAALRENLKRRKAQARQRAAGEDEAGQGPGNGPEVSGEGRGADATAGPKSSA